MLTVKHNIPEIRDKLKRIKTLLTKHPNWQDEAVGLMEKARKTVAKATPRSKGMGSQRGKHLADGWVLFKIGGGGKDRIPVLVVVYNKFTHDVIMGKKPSALLRTAKGGTKNYTLLEVMEYGSPAHVIKPVKAKVLKFEVGGKVVYTKKVHHPGTRPYGMVRVAKAKLKQWRHRFIRRWDNKVQNEWRKG